MYENARESIDRLHRMWYNVSMMKYGEVLQVRIPIELGDKLRGRAEALRVSVSTLARWGLRFAATTRDVAGLLTQTADADAEANDEPVSPHLAAMAWLVVLGRDAIEDGIGSPKWRAAVGEVLEELETSEWKTHLR